MNVRPQTIKFLEENIGNSFLNISLSGVFVVLTPSAKETEAKINICDYIKLKCSAHCRKLLPKQKGKLLNGRRYLPISQGVNIKNM